MTPSGGNNQFVTALGCSAGPRKHSRGSPGREGGSCRSRLHPSGKLHLQRRRDQREWRLLTLPNPRSRGNNSPMRAVSAGSGDLQLGGHRGQRHLLCRSPWTATGNSLLPVPIPGTELWAPGEPQGWDSGAFPGALAPKECPCSGGQRERPERAQRRCWKGCCHLPHLSGAAGGSGGDEGRFTKGIFSQAGCGEERAIPIPGEALPWNSHVLLLTLRHKNVFSLRWFAKG